MQLRRSFLRTGLFALGVCVLAIMSGLLAGQSSASSVPFSDPNAKGYIGFCDANNNNITSGDIGAAPFVWKAVSSTQPPKDYLGKGQNAVLDIFQPRDGVDPGDWSGDSLTAASFYDTSSLPTVQSTTADEPLSDFMRAYPTKLEGLYQLRIYYGKVPSGLYSQTYPATVIEIKGSRWSVVQGGNVSCASATATSDEILSGTEPKADATPAAAGHSSSSSASGSTASKSESSSSSTSAQSGVRSAKPSTSGSAGHPIAAAAKSSAGSSGLLIGLICAAMAAVLAGGGGAWWFFFRPRTASPL